MIPRSRAALATVAASIALLALPALAGANPGTGPDLVRRSGQFVILHADGSDGSTTRQPMLVVGLRQTPVRAPGDVWIEPGSRVRLEGTMQNGVLVLGDTVTAVTELAPARLAGGLGQAPSTETTAVVPFYLSRPDDDRSAGGCQRHDDHRPQVAARVLPRADVRRHLVPDDRVRARAPDAAEARRARRLHGSHRRLGGRGREPQSQRWTQSQYKHIVYVFPALARASAGGRASPRSAGATSGSTGSSTCP